MLYWMCKKSRGRSLTWPQMKHAIMRNFGGLKSDEVDPFQVFCKELNMAEEEPDPEKYVDDQEVRSLAVILPEYHSIRIYTLRLNRYGRLLIRIAQG